MYGLVVTDPSESESEIMHAVFVDCQAPLLFIKRPEYVERRALSKEQRKLFDKAERERALSFGDWISFSERSLDNRFITAYKKEYPLCESRATAEYLQIETVCVFSPAKERETPKCFADLFGLISTPKQVAALFLPDVAIRCWISVEVTRIETVQFSFGAFIDIAEDQSAVYSTPWNRENLRYVVEVNDDSDDHFCNSSPFATMGLSSVLRDMVGVRTGGRTVLCFDYKHIPFLITYNSLNGRASLGDIIIFDAYYSAPLRAYVIGTFRKKDDAPSFGSKMINFGTLPLLEVGAKPSDLPFGYLRAVNEDLGIVHDPHGLLTPALLSSPKDTVFDVYVTDTGANAFTRLRVQDISERTANVVKSCCKRGYMPLKNLEGIVLGNGLVMARNYGMLKIRFGDSSTDGWEELEPGTWIKFTASSESGAPDFVVQKWTKPFECAAESIKHVFISDEHMFQTTCHYREDLGVLESAAFGFVDDPEKICSLKKSGEPIMLWVKKGGVESRTPMIVCSIEESEAGLRSAIEKTCVAIERSTQAIKNGNSEKQSDKNNTQERPLKSFAEDMPFLREKDASCTCEDCGARKLLHELLMSKSMQQVILEAGADELLERAMTVVSLS